MVVRKPVTRAESQERTRQALLAAADERFQRDGYFASTLAQIAGDAGVTKGAVYANFASKAELFQAVRRQWAFSGLPTLGEALAGADDLDGWIVVAADYVAGFGDEAERRQRAYSEFLVEASGAERTAETFRAPYRSTREVTQKLVASELERVLGVTIDAATLVTQVDVFQAAVAGLAIMRGLDPDISAEGYREAFRNLVRGALATIEQGADNASAGNAGVGNAGARG